VDFETFGGFCGGGMRRYPRPVRANDYEKVSGCQGIGGKKQKAREIECSMLRYAEGAKNLKSINDKRNLRLIGVRRSAAIL
jgi:hypothetical protein